MIELARDYGRYGYRMITGMLNQSGWQVNHKRVERIWKREGLKVPQKQVKKGRLWLNDGSCVRLRPERPNHVWSYDFVQDRTHDGRVYRTLNIIDEFTKEAHNGFSPKVIMTLAGHKHLTTTQRYIDVNDEMLRQAVNLV